MYLAGNLVFTKNGQNAVQPWMIMHLPDLLATYAATHRCMWFMFTTSRIEPGRQTSRPESAEGICCMKLSKGKANPGLTGGRLWRGS